ncbi:UvrD-helicase domain-containing protein [uncultured Serinicoccus sp.]|uniref:UvrD-helicase domain-containing protein n=1 Tax=uncultured Serinicoccus sp. TaxID=735514 RepID=UPI0026095382|nr:UvrD-helicase domain-containing protein [uncultured Serinicoccus sp.]
MTSAVLFDGDLSAEQASAVESHVQHIEAGPGAGKTKTMVARFRASVSPDAGIALLSFTNAAVNVARSRCLDEPQLLESPNFVGTFDGFFHRYVVTPAVLRTTGTAPRYLSSWDDLPSELRTVRVGQGAGIRLSRWVRETDGSIKLDESLLDRTERQFWDNQKVTDWTREQIRQAGTNRILGLLQGRTYNATEARRIAIAALERADLAILSKLALRFKEVIVDEFQDCDDLEHRLLDMIRGAGIHTVTIADPDQAIYEFRQVNSGNYEQYVTKFSTQDIVQLETCYRSTPAICALVTSLRKASTTRVVSHLPPDTPCPPVRIIVGGGAEAGAAAVRVAIAYGIAPEATRFVAHKKADAQRLARSKGTSVDSNAAIARILEAIAELRSGADARTRHSAITRIENVVLELFDWGDDGAPGTRLEQLEKLGITSDQLRILISRFITEGPRWTSREACSASIRGIVEVGANATQLPLISTVANRLAKPRENVWRAWASRTENVLLPEVKAVKWTHVHAAKGDEFDAVIYALPSRAVDGSHVLDDWEQGKNTEARRVVYVGVSRARQLVALVVPEGRVDQLERILERDKVPYEVANAQ